eukprot:scaffold808_cov370-Prasinococcus_capsulatus_cf.AAC.7
MPYNVPPVGHAGREAGEEMIARGAEELFCLVHDANVDSLRRRCAGMRAAIAARNEQVAEGAKSPHEREQTSSPLLVDGGELLVPADRAAQLVRVVEAVLAPEASSGSSSARHPDWPGVGLLVVGSAALQVRGRPVDAAWPSHRTQSDSARLFA